MFAAHEAAALEADGDDADGVQEGRGIVGGAYERRIKGQPAETVLGCSRGGLAKMLAPGRRWAGRRWEITLDDTCFVGSPVFAPHGGTWSGPTSEKKGKVSQEEDNGVQRGDARRHDHWQENMPPGTNDDEDNDDDDDERGDVQEGVNRDDEIPSPGATGDEVGGLAMFNVVLALRPSQAEHQNRVTELYENVVKKLAKALRYRQRKVGYVNDQVRSIARVLDRAGESGGFPSNIHRVHHKM